MANDTTVPRIVFESEMARAERNLKRLWLLVLVLVFLLVGSNLAWIVYENQYEDVVIRTQEVEQSVDGDGYNQFVGGDLIGDETKG